MGGEPQSTTASDQTLSVIRERCMDVVQKSRCHLGGGVDSASLRWNLSLFVLTNVQWQIV